MKCKNGGKSRARDKGHKIQSRVKKQEGYQSSRMRNVWLCVYKHGMGGLGVKFKAEGG